jgi:hypothetical protein
VGVTGVMGATSCPAFSVTVKGKIPDIVAAVKKEAAKDNADFKGDETKGSFSAKGGDVKGTYTVDGQKIAFNTKIDSVWIPCTAVQAKLENYFKGK